MSDTETHDDIVTDTTKLRPPANHVRGCENCGMFPTTLCGMPQTSVAPRTSHDIGKIICVVCRDLWLDHIALHEAF